MSGGPAVVDSLAEFEKRFGWPTEPSHLLGWTELCESPSELALAGHGAKHRRPLAAAFTLLSATRTTRPPMGQAMPGLACCDPSRFKIAPPLGLFVWFGALHSLERVCHVTVTLSAA